MPAIWPTLPPKSSGGTFEDAAVQRSPGLLYRRRTSTGATELTGLGPYYPAIIEPRESALARQRDAIERTIRDGARIGAARRELARATGG